MSSRMKFYLLLLKELILWPWLYFANVFKWHFGKVKNDLSVNKVRAPVFCERVTVCIHEWGGYDDKRIKSIRDYKQFECGLYYQLERYQNYRGKYLLDLTVTVSDISLFKSSVSKVSVIGVPNIGMDFSGYSQFYEKIKNLDNQYIILTNTSVNMRQVDFLDDYIDYFKSNDSIGILGVSASSKMYQSLIRNNFNPHLQSFFLLTTKDVLREIVEYNNIFPGVNINHKLLLIREGEILLSRIALHLGYKLACVLEEGEPFLFDRTCFLDNGKSTWHMPFGDYRLQVDNPNSINALNI